MWVKDESGTIKKKESYTYAKNTNVIKDYIPAVATKQFPVIDGWAIEGASYKQYIYPYELTAAIDTIYDTNGNNPLINQTDYVYNAHNFLRSEVTKNSNNQEFMKRYRYAGDYAIPNPTQPTLSDKYAIMSMRTKNMIGCLTEEQTLIKKDGNWNLTKGKLTRYKNLNTSINYQGTVLPYTESFLELSVPSTDTKESDLRGPGILDFHSAYKERIVYNQYNSYGNPVFITKDSTENTVYLWSYKGQYPVAEIKNATYEQVKTQIQGNQATIDAIASDNVLSSTNLDKLNNLRTSLPNAQITTYTYKPLVGITSMTDPRGVKTTYEYDLFGRLQYVKDENNKTIENYDYHYKNQ